MIDLRFADELRNVLYDQDGVSRTDADTIQTVLLMTITAALCGMAGDADEADRMADNFATCLKTCVRESAPQIVFRRDH